MPDERTPALNLPLPHADHLLDEDVERLRAALFALDAAIAGRDVALVQQLSIQQQRMQQLETQQQQAQQQLAANSVQQQDQQRRLRRLWLRQTFGI
ncbi:MAG: hypothetical protein N2690_00495 [Rhodocyclaceae bacterium]|nr:hypothetical protein [Rhodocyclaceae bacterium]